MYYFLRNFDVKVVTDRRLNTLSLLALDVLVKELDLGNQILVMDVQM